MSQQFQHLTTTNYDANLYPYSSPPVSSTPKLGICLSGGGSRALSCALGQLSALNLMPGTNPGQTVLQQAPYLSSVSGGSWASVLYTFLPQTIGGSPVTDADFLIQPVAPGSLTKGGNNGPGNVLYMGPFCLGNVPQQFDLENIAAFLHTLYTWGFFGNEQRWSWFWIAGVGEIVLNWFDLYDGFYNPNNNYPEPANFFSLSDAEVAANITPNNPSLTSDQFYLCRPNRPALIVNTNLLQNYDLANSAQIPIQAKPIATGIPGKSPDGSIVGGGAVESFGFTSTLIGSGTPANSANITFQRRYSLCDIAGCSSAFFASILLGYINEEIDNLISTLETYLEDTLDFPAWLAEVVATAVKLAAEAFLDAESSQIIPQYNYWPLGAVQSNPTNKSYGFSDGGDFDDSGILGMLAQTDANRIIAFVNTEIPLSQGPSPAPVVLDSSLPLLFGYQDELVNGQWTSFGGMSPSQPLSYVQVFSDANNAFETLRNGLFAASCAGGAVGTATATFQQVLTTVANPVANIAAGRQVTVLWVYNNRVQNWQNQIQDSGLTSDLNAGQAGQPSGPLSNFPNYFTGEQVYLDQEAVNMLAQLSAWNVQQLQSQIQALLQP